MSTGIVPEGPPDGVEERRSPSTALAEVREELHGVRVELADKTRSYRRWAIAATVVSALAAVLMALVVVVLLQVNARGRENRALLADVESVTNPQARAAQNVGTKALVDGAVCSIVLELRAVFPTLPLPAGCKAP